MGSKLSAEKSAATKCGVSHEEWKRRRSAGLRRCYECKSWKVVKDFSKDKTRKGGRTSICKPCVSFKSRLSRYGITKEEFNALPGSSGTCPICSRQGQSMEVDHNHDTGKVRGLICSRCNGALGQFRDKISLLKSAIKYLEEYDG